MWFFNTPFSATLCSSSLPRYGPSSKRKGKLKEGALGEATTLCANAC